MKPKFFLTMGMVCLGASVSFAGAKQQRKVQKPPVMLGSTGGNVNHAVNDGEKPRCGSGTLGALVYRGNTQYILSSGFTFGRLNQGEKGEDVIQPGLNYTKGRKCNPKNPKGNVIADVTKYNNIKFKTGKTNKFEAGLAEVRPGMVDPEGTIIGIGVPGGHVIPAFVGQKLQKSGPGTGKKVGVVTFVKATVDVAYGRPFGAPPSARFVKQIIVQSQNIKPLVALGDSGAVFFENRTSCPGWVGLAFAQSADGTIVAATPINTVFKQLKKLKPDKGAVKPVGCDTVATAASEPQALQIQQAMLDAERIQNQVENEVMQLPGVVGMGLGVAKDNPDEVVIKIFVEDDTEAILENIPERLGKVRTEMVRTGRFHAL